MNNEKCERDCALHMIRALIVAAVSAVDLQTLTSHIYQTGFFDRLELTLQEIILVYLSF